MTDELVTRLERIVTEWEEEITPGLEAEQRSRLAWRLWGTVALVVVAIVGVFGVGIGAYTYVEGKNRRQDLCDGIYAMADGLVASGQRQPSTGPRTPEQEQQLEERIARFYADLDARLEKTCSPPSRDP